MSQEELKENAIQKLVGILRTNLFQFEFKVCEKPKGIKIIFEVTQEEMDAVTRGTFSNF